MNIILNAVLIPTMAQNGAAVASDVSEFIVNGVQLYAMSKIVNIPVPSKSLIQGIGTALIMGVIVCAISNLSVGLVLQVVLGVGAGAIVYFATNVLLKNDMAINVISIIKTKFGGYHELKNVGLAKKK